jgi:hypothetical protein
LADELGFLINNFTDNGYGTVFSIRAGAPTSSISVNSAGKAGLGTNAPAQKLHLVQELSPTLRFEQLGADIGPFSVPPQLWDIQVDDDAFLVRDVSHGGHEPLIIEGGAPAGSFVVGANGKVGIGTFAPQGNLHIGGNANQDLFNGMGPDLNSGPAFNFGYSGNSFGPGSGFFNVRGANSGVNPSLRFATVNQQRMIITNAGRVGIGTTSPGVALDVVGTVRASTSIMVGGQTLTVPDYVFEPDYQLMPLTELGSYVAKEKHLPDIPSAREIREQGVNLSALQMQLLKKVEELTLYTLAQERTNQEQQQTIHTLRVENVQLQERLSAVEALVQASGQQR